MGDFIDRMDRFLHFFIGPPIDMGIKEKHERQRLTKRLLKEDPTVVCQALLLSHPTLYVSIQAEGFHTLLELLTDELKKRFEPYQNVEVTDEYDAYCARVMIGKGELRTIIKRLTDEKAERLFDE